jgi:hypothetical protein
LEVAVKPCLKIWIACLAVSFSALPALSQFTAASLSPIYPVGNQSYDGDVAVADFNGDGQPDIASTSIQTSPRAYGFVIQPGNGLGAYAPGPFFAPQHDPCLATNTTCNSRTLIAGDFNGDGKEDLILSESVVAGNAESTSRAYLFAGNGDGTFQAAIDISSFAGTGLVAADLRHNGRLDLVSVASLEANAVQYALSNGNGTFQKPVLIHCPNACVPGVIAVADLGNGHNDILFADEAPYAQGYLSGTLQVALGNGDGSFQPPKLGYDILDIPSRIVTGHFTKDKQLGVAVQENSEEAFNSTQFLSGNSNGTLNYISRTDDAPHGTLELVDLNGDGLDDLVEVYPNVVYSVAQGVQLFVQLADGGGHFNPAYSLLLQNDSCGTNMNPNADLPLHVASLTPKPLPALITSMFPCNAILYNDRSHPLTTSTTLTSNSPTVAYPQPFTLQATVSINDPKEGWPTEPAGEVHIYDGSKLLAQRVVTNGTVTFPGLLLAPAEHDLMAVFTGDTAYFGSTSTNFQQLVQGAPVSVSLQSDPWPTTTFSVPVTFAATVTGKTTVNGIDYTPVGTVALYANNKLIGRRVLQNGAVSLTTSALPLGTDAVYAKYEGNSRFAPTPSNVRKQTVFAIATHLSLAASKNPVPSGQAATFTATITRDAAPDPNQPNGGIYFFDDGVWMGSAQIVSGVATLSISTLSTGTHTITAQYPSGSTAFAPSTSNAVSITVQ